MRKVVFNATVAVAGIAAVVVLSGCGGNASHAAFSSPPAPSPPAPSPSDPFSPVPSPSDPFSPTPSYSDPFSPTPSYSDPFSPTPSPPDPPPPEPAPTAAAISVVWPDGTPAAGAQVELYPSGFSSDLGTPYTKVQLDANGAASLDCSDSCSNLQGFFVESAAANGADAQHGGNECWIVLHDGDALAVSLINGEQATLAMEDLPCDGVPYNPSDVSSVAEGLATGDPSYGYSGTWQDARNRLQAP